MPDGCCWISGGSALCSAIIWSEGELGLTPRASSWRWWNGCSQYVCIGPGRFAAIWEGWLDDQPWSLCEASCRDAPKTFESVCPPRPPRNSALEPNPNRLVGDGDCEEVSIAGGQPQPGAVGENWADSTCRESGRTHLPASLSGASRSHDARCALRSRSRVYWPGRCIIRLGKEGKQYALGFADARSNTICSKHGRAGGRQRVWTTATRSVVARRRKRMLVSEKDPSGVDVEREQMSSR